ncbi:4-hydroxyphenyl-beta-ketoacyl-CoA hydrolase [Microtetraspora sp. NBRC 13810]|uniref:amidohydrolase family protein n=1 Tax=Microtetraspora sp. NBRC 13810 TaxID=3030990 RepID=UPI00249FA70B|nr:amidohydrolase family protein [Microtetraspora sp. NBRC 13810]GLW11935.1 4-hydroxyphenyl-beta-ketoacyl-CoA hydrolase [Microtetraspora sp. NBRC 13810]
MRAKPALDDLVAIDVHTHVHRSVSGRGTAEDLDAMGSYFKTDVRGYDVRQLAAHYRARSMLAVVFTVDTLTATGDEPVPSSEEIAEVAAEHADAVIPFASVDPGRGKAGVRLARRLIEEYGVAGFKFHPSAQGFFPDDPAVYPLYEVIAEHRLPALFHTGQTGIGAGTRGGGGIRLKYSNPLHLDDVAVDFPDMPIVLAHPSFPWQEEALAVALHKPQVYIDLSGWSPKYFPPLLVQYANTLLKDKVLFGTDFPLLTPERWMADLEKTAIRDEVKPGIFKHNAARLLGLG